MTSLLLEDQVYFHFHFLYNIFMCKNMGQSDFDLLKDRVRVISFTTQLG